MGLMKASLNSFISCFLLLVLFTACKQQDGKTIDIRNSDHIENLRPLLSNNLQTITIDDLEETIININPNVESSVLVDSVLIADLSDVEFEGKYLFLVDRKKHQVIRYDMVEQTVKKIGQAGRGPGDFNEPTEISINTDHYFVYERGNARVQIFNKEFDPVSEMAVIASISGTAGSMDVNDFQILLPNFVASEIPNAIRVISFGNGFNKIWGIFPRVSQIGEPNFGLNITKIRKLPNQGFVVSYFGLPYMFFLDEELSHTCSYKFVGSYVDDFYQLIPERLKSETSNYVRGFISSFDFSKDQLYLLIQGDLFLIDPNRHEVQKRYRFKTKNGNFFGTMVRVHNSRLYLIDRSFSNSIIEIPLDKDGNLVDREGKFIMS